MHNFSINSLLPTIKQWIHTYQQHKLQAPPQEQQLQPHFNEPSSSSSLFPSLLGPHDFQLDGNAEYEDSDSDINSIVHEPTIAQPVLQLQLTLTASVLL